MVDSRLHRLRLSIGLVLLANIAACGAPSGDEGDEAIEGGATTEQPLAKTPDGKWGMEVFEGGAAGFYATPTCGAGEQVADKTADNLAVGPNGFLVVEPHRFGAVNDDVITRTIVKYDDGSGEFKNWDNMIHHGPQTGDRQLTRIEQAWALDFTGANSPVVASFGALPSVGHPITWRLMVQFSLQKVPNIVASCEARVVVWHPSDPKLPAGTMQADNVPHPSQHAPVTVPALTKPSFAVFRYPGGPSFPSECDGHDNQTDTADFDNNKGGLRLEPSLSSPDPITIDTWVFYDVGAGPRFSWRQRTANHERSGASAERSQGNTYWGIRLPSGPSVLDHQPITFTTTNHFHVQPGSDDLMGQICEARVTVK